MAVAPMFNTSMSVLKQKVQLSGAADADALAGIDEAVQSARVLLLSRLSTSRISTLLGTAEVENPLTKAQGLRSLASQAEVAIVLVWLIDRFGVRIVEGTADSLERWNEEGMLRQMPFYERRAMKVDMNRWIELALAALEAGDLTLLSGSGSLSVSSFDNESRTDVGSRVFHPYDNPFRITEDE